MSVRRRRPLREIYHALLALLPDEWAIQLLYFRNFKRFADLRAPRTFSEKTNWRKLHQRDPRFTLYADKAAVKDEVARLIGREHIVPTLWTGERPEDIPFDELTPPYVVKVNHGYGSNLLIRRREDVDRGKVRAALVRALRHPHGRVTRQWAYYDIPRKIVIEPMLDIYGREAPEDYKFFVYHGRAHFVQIIVDRWGKNLVACYDRDWNKMVAPWNSRDIERPVPRPPLLDEMIGIAEKIGASFDFVRVDLYHASNTVFFGEATFYHSAGYSAVITGDLDRVFGEPWTIRPYPPPEAPRAS